MEIIDKKIITSILTHDYFGIHKITINVISIGNIKKIHENKFSLAWEVQSKFMLVENNLHRIELLFLKTEVINYVVSDVSQGC